MRCISVDWAGNKHKAKAAVRLVDITTLEGKETLAELLAQPSLKFD